MKSVVLALILVLAGLAVGGRAEANERAKERIIFGVPDQESFPNILGKRELVDPPGIYLEILQRIAADLGFDAEFVRLPTKRILKDLCDGTIDVAVEFSYVAERARCGRYPMKNGEVDSDRRLDSIAYYLYTREDAKLAWDGNRFTHLSGKLGANMGYSIVDDLTAMGLEVETTTDTESNLLKLQAGRIAGYVQISTKVEVMRRTDKLAGIRKHPIPVRSKAYYILFSHPFYERNPALAERTWSRLGELREGMMGTLLPKYMKP